MGVIAVIVFGLVALFVLVGAMMRRRRPKAGAPVHHHHGRYRRGFGRPAEPGPSALAAGRPAVAGQGGRHRAQGPAGPDVGLSPVSDASASL